MVAPNFGHMIAMMCKKCEEIYLNTTTGHLLLYKFKSILLTFVLFVNFCFVFLFVVLGQHLALHFDALCVLEACAQNKSPKQNMKTDVKEVFCAAIGMHARSRNVRKYHPQLLV